MSGVYDYECAWKMKWPEPPIG